eukprot:3335-Heterococcus_DN1.PRE.5
MRQTAVSSITCITAMRLLSAMCKVAAHSSRTCCEVHPSALAHATSSSDQDLPLQRSTVGHSAPCCRNHCAAAS